MKKLSLLTRLITIGFFASFLLTGCKKETSNSTLSPEQEEQAATLSSQAETETELVFNDVFDNVMGVNTEVGLGGTGVFGRTSTGSILGGRETGVDSIPGCVTLTITRLSPPEKFPVRIVMDFGGGCPGKDGHVRSGKIITTYTGRVIASGNSATVTFDGFKIDSLSIQGTYKISNTTDAASHQRQFTIDVTDARISRPNGNYSQWTSQRVITQVEGNGTPDLPIDDLFTITGGGHGKVKHGSDYFAWHSEIVEPLRKRFLCHWISRGTIKVRRETLAADSRWVATLDYGNGLCDFLATLTLNGVTHELKLPH